MTHRNIYLSFPARRSALYEAVQEYTADVLEKAGGPKGRGRGLLSKSSIVLDLIEQGLLRVAETDYDQK